MKTPIRLIAVVAIVVIGLGFYRGWFTLTGNREAATSNAEVKLSVDTDKFQHDTEAVTDGMKKKESHDER